MTSLALRGALLQAAPAPMRTAATPVQPRVVVVPWTCDTAEIAYLYFPATGNILDGEMRVHIVTELEEGEVRPVRLPNGDAVVVQRKRRLTTTA